MVGKSSPQEIAALGIIREISDSNLEKSGDWEVWSKIWSLPDYPGELTALRRGPTKQLFALDFFKEKFFTKQLELIKIKSKYWSLLFLYIKADNNFNKREKERK